MLRFCFRMCSSLGRLLSQWRVGLTYILERFNKMNEDDELYCPIRKSVCTGKNCIFAVKIDNPLSNPYANLYICGLVNVCEHGIPKYIDSEPRFDE